MPRPSDRRVVLADVARAAGTSEATASRALKNDPRIGVQTQAAVKMAAQKLGYVPNAAARSLRAQRTHILGLLVDDLADPVHGQVAAGFEAAAAARGYAVFIMTGLHDPERELRALRAFVEHRADGVTLGSCVSPPTDVYARIAPQRVVFVQPDYPALGDGEQPPARGVLQSDDRAGFTATVRHLVDRGYRRIGYVGPGVGASDAIRRAATMTAAQELLGTPVLTFDSGLDGWRDGAGIAYEIAEARLDALMCFDDKLALAMLDALRGTSVDVPAGLAVTGFDGIAGSRQSLPRLTTVAVPSAELGRRAVEMLASSVRDGEMPRSETLPVTLVVRDSSPERAPGSAPPLAAARHTTAERAATER
jgi:DNA-binding LacI/PurR family transcriptional regulator